MTFQEELLILLKARYPIIYVITIEEDRLEYTIRNAIINKTYSNLYVWDFIEGYKTNPMKKGFGKRNPLEALEFISKVNSRTPSIFILKDFKRFLKDLTISRKLRNITQLLKLQPKTIIIVDSEVQIPNELKDHITLIKFNLPAPKEIKNELVRLTKNLTLQGKLSQKILEKVIQACQGLSLEKIRRVLGKAIVIYKQIDKNSIPIILGEKRQVISQTELLEFWSTKVTLKDVGGAYNLKQWLNARTEIFSEQAINYGLVTPKGVLIIGMQGSGKSLIAKAVAYEWRLPLLRLDVGRLFAGVVGESESRVREMITIAESLAPCILWVDEIDKAFSDAQQNLDSGTTIRVLATFVTWLGEKTLPVFVIATANDIYSLPVEILRKGRFDETFFLGIPTTAERKLIYEVHLRRFRPDTWYEYDTIKLSRRSRKFSGAEIEQTIVDAMYVAFSEYREFTTNDILIAIKETIPILEMDPLRTQMVQNWALSGRIRVA
uniref:hypothetical protein n=1 Tax=Halosiphon tomentosus TaxID=64927 RepID=UPI002E77E38E|nr:hypothetical protein V2488_pgp042 [Halosiphon tomentosus]WAM63779.1 hypothetical protein [Halosiphon tomentosus]